MNGLNRGMVVLLRPSEASDIKRTTMKFIKTYLLFFTFFWGLWVLLVFLYLPYYFVTYLSSIYTLRDVISGICFLRNCYESNF